MVILQETKVVETSQACECEPSLSIVHHYSSSLVVLNPSLTPSSLSPPSSLSRAHPASKQSWPLRWRTHPTTPQAWRGSWGSNGYFRRVTCGYLINLMFNFQVSTLVDPFPKFSAMLDFIGDDQQGNQLYGCEPPSSLRGLGDHPQPETVVVVVVVEDSSASHGEAMNTATRMCRCEWTPDPAVSRAPAIHHLRLCSIL